MYHRIKCFFFLLFDAGFDKIRLVDHFRVQTPERKVELQSANYKYLGIYFFLQKITSLFYFIQLEQMSAAEFERLHKVVKTQSHTSQVLLILLSDF